MQMQRHKCASYPKFVGCSFLMPTATNPGLIHLVVSLALHDSTIRQAEAEASSRPFGTPNRELPMMQFLKVRAGPRPSWPRWV